MRFVLAAGLAGALALRVGERLDARVLPRLLSNWLNFRLWNQAGERESAENPSDFLAMSVVRQSHFRWLRHQLVPATLKVTFLSANRMENVMCNTVADTLGPLEADADLYRSERWRLPIASIVTFFALFLTSKPQRPSFRAPEHHKT